MIANVTNDNGAIPGFRHIYPAARLSNNNAELGTSMSNCLGPISGAAISHGNVGYFVTGGQWNTPVPAINRFGQEIR